MQTLTFNTFLQQSPLNLALQGQGSIYLAPNIPDKKLVGAQYYLPKHVQPNQVIILIDDTVFGSAKIGLCITELGLYYKADFEELVYCSWQHIHSIDTDIGMINRNIMINRQLKLNFTQPERQAIQAIADLINAFIRQRMRQAIQDRIAHSKKQFHPQCKVPYNYLPIFLHKKTQRCIQMIGDISKCFRSMVKKYNHI